MIQCGAEVVSFEENQEEFKDLDDEDIEDVTDLSNGNLVEDSDLAVPDLDNAVAEGSPAESPLSRMTDSEIEDAIREAIVKLLDK